MPEAIESLLSVIMSDILSRRSRTRRGCFVVAHSASCVRVGPFDPFDHAFKGYSNIRGVMITSKMGSLMPNFGPILEDPFRLHLPIAVFWFSYRKDTVNGTNQDAKGVIGHQEKSPILIPSAGIRQFSGPCPKRFRLVTNTTITLKT